MVPKNFIPDIIIRRLPVYLRALQIMLDDDRTITSSQELGERLGLSAAQIRKDLSQFGEFGKQGTGYDVSNLISELHGILNLEEIWEMVVIGAGGIGSAIAKYSGFKARGFHVKMIFDNNQDLIGKLCGDLKILDLTTLKDNLAESGIKLGVIAVPSPDAQEVAKNLVDAGIKAILNYAPIRLYLPKDILVEYIDPSVHLQRMTYYL